MSELKLKTGYMKLSDVIISEDFRQTKPRSKKVIQYTLDIVENNFCQTREIEIDENGILTDGYIQYLILKQLKIKKIYFSKAKAKNSPVVEKVPKMQKCLYFLKGIPECGINKGDIRKVLESKKNSEGDNMYTIYFKWDEWDGAIMYGSIGGIDEGVMFDVIGYSIPTEDIYDDSGERIINYRMDYVE